MLRTALQFTILMSALILAQSCAAEWHLDTDGACVWRWTAHSLERGPIEIANAPLMPARGVAGGVVLLRDPEYAQGNWGWKIATAPFVLAAGAVVGTVEAGISLIAGIADTFTGGYFEILPDSWSELSVQPIPLLNDPVPPSPDRCSPPPAVDIG